MLVSETRSGSNTAGPYLVVVLLARMIGYSLLGYKEVGCSGFLEAFRKVHNTARVEFRTCVEHSSG